MKRNKLLSFIIVALTAIILTSCNTTQITASWASETIPAHTLDKVAVFALLGKKDQLDVKQDFEYSVATSLIENGVQAEASYKTYGPDGMKGKSEGEVITKLQRDGFTSVMIISLIDKDSHTTYVPGTVYNTPSMYGGFYPYYNYYGFRYDQVYTPGYYQTNTQYLLEVRLYNVDDKKDAIYVGQTKTINPNDAYTMSKEFASVITKDMSDEGLIQKATK